MEDKKSLASEKERAKVEGKASLLAAVDYYVSMHTDIFISASPGNMHNAMVCMAYLFRLTFDAKGSNMLLRVNKLWIIFEKMLMRKAALIHDNFVHK